MALCVTLVAVAVLGEGTAPSESGKEEIQVRVGVGECQSFSVPAAGLSPEAYLTDIVFHFFSYYKYGTF